MNASGRGPGRGNRIRAGIICVIAFPVIAYFAVNLIQALRNQTAAVPNVLMMLLGVLIAVVFFLRVVGVFRAGNCPQCGRAVKGQGRRTACPHCGERLGEGDEAE